MHAQDPTTLPLPAACPVPSADTVEQLASALIGDLRAAAIRRSMALPDGTQRSGATRAEIALALGALLFEGIQERVPLARAYVIDAVRAGRRLQLDHGALRTVAASSGALPGGSAAFARLLEPLGYVRAAAYPLEPLGMTGFAFCHEDLPEDIPQYFVSELHPERFSEPFQRAVERVIATTRDPMTPRAAELLDELARERALPFGDALELLPELLHCFGRHHEEPSLRDYETLLGESSEMAWIATEGNAFNHATDRVDDVFAVAEAQKALGRPLKDEVEVSANGRVMQTALRAATVQRLFRSDEGHLVVRDVPGSFHEFITRSPLPDGGLDLTFDTGNAASIFKMTTARKESA